MAILSPSRILQASAPASSSASPAIVIPASFAVGPALMGVFINLLLYGIVLAQTFFYYATYKRDKRWIKLYVAAIFFLDTVNCAMDMQWVYNVLINNFNNNKALLSGNWVFATDPAFVGSVACMSQLFFAWRIHVLTGKWYIVAWISILSVTSALGAFGSALAVHWVPDFPDFRKFQVVVILWLVTASACDVSITLVLTWHLRRHRTGFSSTDDVLDRIIKIAVQNGLITSVWATMDLILFLGVPTGAHLAFNLPLGKLYTNSLMSSLNSRALWSDRERERSHQIATAVNPGSQVQKIEMVNLSTGTRPEVFVQVETHQVRDTIADTKVRGNNPVNEDEWDRQTASIQGDTKTTQEA